MIVARMLNDLGISFLSDLLSTTRLPSFHFLSLGHFSHQITLSPLNCAINIVLHFLQDLQLGCDLSDLHLQFSLLRNLILSIRFIVMYGYCTVCYTEHVFNGNNAPNYGKCMKCGKIDGVRYLNEVPFVAYCPKCFAEHKTH